MLASTCKIPAKCFDTKRLYFASLTSFHLRKTLHNKIGHRIGFYTPLSRNKDTQFGFVTFILTLNIKRGILFLKFKLSIGDVLNFILLSFGQASLICDKPLEPESFTAYFTKANKMGGNMRAVQAYITARVSILSSLIITTLQIFLICRFNTTFDQ